MNVGNSYRSEIRLNRPACYRGGELTYLQHVINSSVPPSPSELRKLTAYLTEKIIRTSPSELSKYAEDIKGLFKILKKSGSEASFRKLIESLNKIKAKRLRSEDHVLWAANFIKKDTLLKMAEKCLDNQGIKQARYYLMSYFLCFKKGEIIDEENELTIRKIINTSAEAFQSTSYLKQGVNDIEKQGQVIHKEMFMDLVFLKMGEAVFNDQSGKHIEPYKVIQKLIGSLIVTKASFNEDTTNPPIKFTETQRILIDDGYHGEADKVIFYEDEHSQEDKTITSEEHYIETVNTTSDSNQIDEHASLSYSNGTQRANQHSDNATLSEQRSANQNSERRENEMARGGRQDIADQSASKTLSTDQKTSNLRNDGTRNLGSKSIGETYESMACKERGVRTKNGKESVTAWKKNESTNPRNIGVSFGGVGFDMAVKNDSSSTDNSSEEREQNSNENSDTRTNRDTSGIRDELRTDEEITRNSTTDVSYQTGGSSSAHNNSTHTVTNDLESGSASVNMTSEGQGVSTTRSNERMVSSHDDHNQSGSFDVRGHRDHSSGGSQMFHGTDHAEHNSTISKIHLERQTKTLKKGHYYFQMIEKELNVEDQKVNAIFTYSGLSFENLDQYRRIKEPALKPLVERLTNVVYRRSFSEYHRKKTQRKKNIISSFELNNDKFLQIIELVRAFNNIKKQYGDYWLKIEGYKDNEKQWHEAISECFRVCALKEPDKRLIEMKYKELFKIFYSLILNPDFNLSLEGTFLNKLNEFTKRIYGGEIPKFPPNEGSGVIFHHDDGTNGFYLGNGTISLDHSYKHVLIKGSTGIGKSSQIFIPGILALNDENALVTDIDGTIYKATAERMRQKGYNVVVLDLMNPSQSSTFNPLAGLKVLDERIDEILDAIFSNVKTEGDNAVFLENAKSLSRFMINKLIYNHKHNDGEVPTLPLFKRALNRFSFQDLKNNYEELHEKVTSSSASKDLTDLYDQVCSVANISDDVFNSAKVFIGPAIAVLGKDVPSQITSGEDTVFDTLSNQDEKTIIYLRVSGNDVTNYKVIMGLFFQHFFRFMKQGNPSPDRRPTLCYLDEFGNYNISGFATIITTIRKFNVGIMVGLQSDQQVLENYKGDGKTILENFNTKLYMGLSDGDRDTVEYLVDAAGQIDTQRINPINGEFMMTKEGRLSNAKLYGLKQGYGVVATKGQFPIIYQFVPPPQKKDLPSSDNETDNPAQDHALIESKQQISDEGPEEEIKVQRYIDPEVASIESQIFHDQSEVNAISAAKLEGFYLTNNESFLIELFTHLGEYDFEKISKFIDQIKDSLKHKYKGNIEELLNESFPNETQKIQMLTQIAHEKDWRDALDFFIPNGISLIDFMHIKSFKANLFKEVFPINKSPKLEGCGHLIDQHLIESLFEKLINKEVNCASIMQIICDDRLDDLTKRAIKFFVTYVYYDTSLLADSDNLGFLPITYVDLFSRVRPFFSDDFNPLFSAVANVKENNQNLSNIKVNSLFSDLPDVKSDKFNEFKKALEGKPSLSAIELWFGLSISNEFISLFMNQLLEAARQSITSFFKNKIAQESKCDVFNLLKDAYGLNQRIEHTFSQILSKKSNLLENMKAQADKYVDLYLLKLVGEHFSEMSREDLVEFGFAEVSETIEGGSKTYDIVRTTPKGDKWVYKVISDKYDTSFIEKPIKIKMVTLPIEHFSRSHSD